VTFTMHTRHLGPLTVSALGLGCMGMSEFYGPTDEAEGIATIHRALDLGVTMLDTADVYGPHTNEILVGKAVKGRRDAVVIATKFGIVRDPSQPERRGISGKPEYVRASCEASLKRLGVETIDLYYQHRIDRSTPIEETVGEMSKLVQEGKVRYLGLSEASPATLERACKVHPIAALQTEYSLFYREPEQEILPACRRLGVGFVGYSPLGRGLLGGTIRKADDLTPGDWRLQSPRYQGDNLAHNVALVERVEAIATAKGCSSAQLAIAWALVQGGDIVPIPGTKRITYLEQNVAALDVRLTAADLAALDAVTPAGAAAAGERYQPAMMGYLNG
jgi:aryl-alcohol dehydrogenase-like predicted oxidoreductase